jgi:acetyl-CoA C-acetyltransferase/acetyl-CoA acyltransferase
MLSAYLVDGVRSPIGRYAGVLSTIRPDDLAAHVLDHLVARHPSIDWQELDDVLLGCANQAGEDNRDVARMAVLLSVLPETVSGTTINRLCGSGADAVSMAARTIISGQADLVVAGGVESMSRAPFVLPKASAAFSRKTEIYDTTIGWRFVNSALAARHGTDTMGETAENVAEDFDISREDQDAFALRSQQRAGQARENKWLNGEIVPVVVPGPDGHSSIAECDEHLRQTSLPALAALPPAFREGGSVTAGNSSGINDGAAVLLIASEAAVTRHNLKPLARITGAATAGVPPRIMGFGPAPATRKLLERSGLKITDVDLLELNEAFASQALAVLRNLGLPDDADHVNPNGGAIALGHPLGMTGARLVLTAARELRRTGGNLAVATMCIGVGQGISVLIEAVPDAM